MSILPSGLQLVYFDPITRTVYQPSEIEGQMELPSRSYSGSDLVSAAKNDDSEEALKIVDLLDKEELQYVDSGGQTALHGAAFHGNEALCRSLLEKMDEKTISKKTDQTNETALSFAARENKKEFVLALQQTHPQLLKSLANSVDINGETPFQNSAKKWGAEIMEILYPLMSSDKICLPLDVKGEKVPVLVHLAKRKYPRYVQILLTNPDVATELCKQVDKLAQTALHWAVGLEQVELCRMLYVHHKNAGTLGIQNQRGGHTALHFAVATGKIEMVKIFTESADHGDALFGLADLDGLTPLHHAILLCGAPISRCLLEKMTPDQICLPSNERIGLKNVLHFAVEENKIEIIRELLSQEGVAVRLLNGKDAQGKKPLDLAKTSERKDIESLLSEAMGRLDVK